MHQSRALTGHLGNHHGGQLGQALAMTTDQAGDAPGRAGFRGQRTAAIGRRDAFGFLVSGYSGLGTLRETIRETLARSS